MDKKSVVDKKVVVDKKSGVNEKKTVVNEKKNSKQLKKGKTVTGFRFRQVNKVNKHKRLLKNKSHRKKKHDGYSNDQHFPSVTVHV